MLHILWILIKFILIILGILLGLALLALLLLLFCPLRYRAQAVKETDSFREAELEAGVSWLFHAVGARIWLRNGERKLEIMIFGISLERIKGWIRKFKGSKKKSAQTESRLPMTESVPEEKPVREIPEPEKPEPEKSEPEKLESERSEPESMSAEPLVPAEPSVQEESDESSNKSAARPGLFIRIREILSKMIRFPGEMWNKLISFVKNINKKIRHIKKTVSGITDKLGWWKAFLTNERTKAAFALVWKDAKGLVHHILPTQVEGQVTFGCEDPSVTGAALAVLGMSFPFHKNRIQINPLFDGENQLIGNVFLKGRIYGIVFVKTAIEIYFNKNIKYVINRWKHKEDEKWKTKTTLKKP